jgi:hypothetical protein
MLGTSFVLSQSSVATRWAKETFLSQEGLKEDFDLMACNADMSFVIVVQMPRY